MKFKTTIIALFSFFLCFSQEGKTIKSGVITLTTGTKKEFVNLTYKDALNLFENSAYKAINVYFGDHNAGY